MTKTYFPRLSRRIAPLLATLLLVLGGRAAQAQVSNYTFTAVAGTYAPLGFATNQVAAIQTDDAVSVALPIGFTFAYNGALYTQVVASSNGFLSFNTAATNTSTNSLSGAATAIRPLLAPLWDNLAGSLTATPASRASYSTSGTGGSQTFTFEWANWQWNQTAAGAVVSFQVKLHEGSNLIEFSYRPGTAAPVAGTASIGLAGNVAGDFLSLSDATAAPTASSTVENASIGTVPASGQLYRFTPGAFACTAPTNVTAGNITPTSASISFTGSAGATSYAVTYTPAGGTPTTVTPAPTASPVTLSGLTLGTVYTVSVASNCAGGTTSAAATTTFTPAAVPYCTANLGGACGGVDAISLVRIAGTTLNNPTHPCAVTNGSAYASFPATGNTTATLSGGAGNYSLTVTTAAVSFIALWIDYDHSGTFDAGEFTRVALNSQAGMPTTGTFAVPATALQGPTGLRIRTRRQMSNGFAAADACLNVPSGGTEDYTVTIGAPAACPTPSAVQIRTITAAGAQVNFTGTASATSYTVTYTPQGGTPTTVTPAPTASPVALTGLTPATAYTVTLVSNCASGASTPTTATFTTLATAPANDDCAGAINVPVTPTCTTPTAGTVVGATQSLAPTPGCGFPAQNALDVWYSFVAAATSQLVQVTPQFAATVNVRAGACAASTSLDCGQVQPNGTLSRTLTGLTVGATYYVRIYPAAPATAATSGFTICITSAPTPPANDDCAAATSVPVTATCTTPTAGTVAGATQSLAPTPGCGGGGPGGPGAANDVWYSFVATATSHTLIGTPQFAAVYDLRSGPCATSTSLNCYAVNPNGNLSRTVTGLTVGTTYFVRVYSLGGATATTSGFTLCVTNAPVLPANDDCASAVTVPVTPTCTSPTAGTIAGATQSIAPTANCGGGPGAAPTAADVWYSFTATGTSNVVTLNPGFDAAVVDVRSGPCATSTSVSCGTYTARAASSRLITGLTSGTTYFVRVYSLLNNQPIGTPAGFTLCISPAPVVPANDDCTAAIALPVTADCTTPTNGTVAGATQSLNPTTPCGGGGPGPNAAPDVWYSFVATATSHVVTANAQFNGVVDVRSGTCTNSTSLMCNTTPRIMTVTGLTVGSTYFVRIYPLAGAPVGTGAAFQLCVTAVPVVPANDDPCGAVALPNNVLVTSTNSGATNTTNMVAPGLVLPTSCGNTGTPKDVWFTMTAPGPTATISVSGAAATQVRVFTAASCSTAFVEVGCRIIGAGTAQPLVFTGLTAGQRYYVAVSGASSNGLTGAFTITANAVLGTAAARSINGLAVYPNPSNTGSLTLRLDNPATGQATLYNALGQAVLTQALTAGAEATLPTRGFAAGLYTLRVQTGGAVLTRKVVLE